MKKKKPTDDDWTIGRAVAQFQIMQMIVLVLDQSGVCTRSEFATKIEDIAREAENGDMSDVCRAESLRLFNIALKDATPPKFELIQGGKQDDPGVSDE